MAVAILYAIRCTLYASRDQEIISRQRSPEFIEGQAVL